MAYAIAIILGYFLGCSNMAYYLAKGRKADLTKAGSGNLGASNATILLGWKAGILVAVHDIGKAALAVLAVKWLFPGVENAPAAAGVACVLGHIFPFWLRFKGGKGFASYIGMTIALNWKLALCVLVAVVIVTLLTDYIFASGSWGQMESKALARAVRDGKHSPLGFSGRLLYLWQTAFPPVQTLRGKYKVLKKAPWLLPVVWLVRPFYKVLFEFRSLKNQERNLAALSRENVDSRQKFLHLVGLDYRF